MIAMTSSGRTLPLLPLICALGIAQILSWGSLYYPFAVLGDSMCRDLGISSTTLFGAFTGSLFISGLVAPRIGRMMDHHGARPVMAAGSVIAATALVLYSVARGPFTVALAAAVAGVALAICLYEAAFIALGQVAAERHRKAVTALTLFGGFASTLSWPFSQWLLHMVGWRGALLTYAALQLLVCLPLHWRMLPRRVQTKPAGERIAAPPAASPGGKSYVYLALAFAGNSFVLALISVHIIKLYRLSGLSDADAVLVASLFGPMQVLGRLLEMRVARHWSAVAVGIVAHGMMVLSLVGLLAVQGFSPLAIAVAGVYGMGNGLMTIVRGIVPAELYGRESYGALIGRLSRPAFAARAMAPFGLPFLLDRGLSPHQAVVLLAVVALAATAAYVMAVRSAREERMAHSPVLR